MQRPPLKECGNLFAYAAQTAGLPGHAAPTEKPSRQLTVRRPYAESLGSTEEPEAFVMLLMWLLPQQRWFDGAGGRGLFLHTPISQ